jgi:hypothetical protein
MGLSVGGCVETGADVGLTNGAGAEVLVLATGLWLGVKEDGDLVAAPATGDTDGVFVTIEDDGALVAADGAFVAAAGAFVALVTAGANVVGRRDEFGAAVPAVPVDGAFAVGDTVDGALVLPLETGDDVLAFGDDVGDAVPEVVGALVVALVGLPVEGDDVEDDGALVIVGLLVKDGALVGELSALGEAEASLVDEACVGALLLGMPVVGLWVVGL